jgi:hypothetical protein
MLARVSRAALLAVAMGALPACGSGGSKCCGPLADGSGMGGAGGLAGTGGGGGTGDGDAGDTGVASSVWRPFNDQSPWNTPIATDAAVDPDSAALIADFSTISGQTALWINIQQYSVPVYWVDSTATSLVSVMATDIGGTGFRTGAASDSVAPGSGMAPIPAGAMAAQGTDRHLSIVDRVARVEWGLWNAAPATTGTGWSAGVAATQDLAGDGVRPPERNNPWWAGHGPRACGFGVVAGLITADEMRAGAIEHALVIAYPHIRSRYYTPPASSAQGTTSEAIATRGILCGGHIQLDPALDLTTLGLAPGGLAIARALQKYGAFVGDFSGAVSLYADASADAQAYWSTGVLDNGSAQAIPLDRFRVLTIGTTYDNMN